MFNKNNHKIIDERQELQSLKNMKICWLTIISLLALSIMIQAVVFFARTFCNEMQCKSVTPQMIFTC
jgi:hypothetical protein